MSFRDRYRPRASPSERRQSPAVVFAVGRRVFVTCPAAVSRVTLSDDSGVTLRGSLRDGAEVEIVAWRPLGSQGTRYLVRSAIKGVEGWLGAADIRGSRVSKTTTAEAAPLAASRRVAR